MTVITPLPVISSNQGLSASGPITLLTAGPDTGQNDLIPALHLRRWGTTGIKFVDILGDSTAGEGISNTAWQDPTQCLSVALRTEVIRRNPQLQFVFNNRAIGGANWNDPMQPGNSIINAHTMPWYTDLTRIWIDYVRDDTPDTLFIILGTNAARSGQFAGSSVALYINNLFTYIGTWSKIPDIILCTNKIANPAAPGEDFNSQEAYKAMSAFQRTFVRSKMRGYAAFPRIQNIGLIDFGRQYGARAYGKDFAMQYMSRVSSAIHSGYTLVGPAPTVTTLGTTTDGDFSVTILFHNAGGTAMYAALGALGFVLNFSAFPGNRIGISLGSGGTWITRYQLTGVITDPVWIGVIYSPPVGDVTMTVTMKGETVRVLINDTYVIDTALPRLIQNSVVSIGTGATPIGSITFDVTDFLEGIAAPVMQTIDPGVAFGAVGGPTGGNDINHPSSTTIALIDYQTAAATNFAAPQPTADEIEEDAVKQIYANGISAPSTGVAIGVEEVIMTATIAANQLLNIGDILAFEAWGSLAGTTDTRTARVRFGGLTGVIIVQIGATIAAGVRWRATGSIMKSAVNAQLVSGQGSVSASNYSTNSNVWGNVDTASTTLVVTSQNSTAVAAGSITCDGFSVVYKKAPGT